jgi:hypothetical protein
MPSEGNFGASRLVLMRESVADIRVVRIGGFFVLVDLMRVLLGHGILI